MVVHAAAGGVGLLLTQMVKMRGGVVVATTSSPAKADLARQAGADHLTGYAEFGSVVEEVTGGTGAAVVYDGVGQATFDASLAAIRPRGMMVLYGGSSGPVPPFELQRLAGAGSLFITRPTMIHYIASREELVWRTGDLFTWITEGQLSVRIGGTYPLADAARAHDDLAARRTTGKLLLLPADQDSRCPGRASSPAPLRGSLRVGVNLAAARAAARVRGEIQPDQRRCGPDRPAEPGEAAGGGRWFHCRFHRDRYHAAELIYLAEVDPMSLADVVVDNRNFANPRICS